MKKFTLILLLCLTTFIFITFFSCDDAVDPPISSTTLGYSIAIEDSIFDAAGIYDFGVTEAENTGKSIEINLTNENESDFTITSVDISDTINYSFSAGELPLTAAPDTDFSVSCSFIPLSSGVFTASLSITIEGFSTPVVLNLSGEGNYAPGLSYGINVTGAGNPAVNGFYERVSEIEQPVYQKDDVTDYFCYFNSEMSDWYIGPTLMGFDELYYYNDYSNSMYRMLPPDTGWEDDSDDASPPSILQYDITGDYADTAEELTANYLYSDADGDLEDAALTKYQWYRSDAQDGVFTPISGATSKTYTPLSDENYYLKVEITPSALTGITAGAAVMSRPTVIIKVLPDP